MTNSRDAVQPLRTAAQFRVRAPVADDYAPAWPLVLIGVCIATFGVLFGDRHGFEGDDVALMFGIANFDRVGFEDLYRYYWQPLAYELLFPVARALDSGFALTFVGNLAGALGLGLLIALLARMLTPILDPGRRITLAAMLALCVPELTVTMLYFNSTSLGLPLVAGSLLALHIAAHGGHPRLIAGTSGALAALACLVRLDFAVLVPFALTLAFVWGGRKGSAIALAWLAGGFVVALAFLAWRPAFPTGALAVARQFEAGEAPIDTLYRLRVIVLALGPAVFVFALMTLGIVRLARYGRVRGERMLTVPNIGLGLALAITLLPVNNLYSGKYLVPLFIGLSIYVAHLLAQAYRQAGVRGSIRHSAIATPVRLSIAAVIASVFIGIPAFGEGRPPSLAAAFSNPLRANTHDGVRSFGGYLAAAQWVRDGRHRYDFLRFFGALAQVVNDCRRDVDVVMPVAPEDATDNWAWAQMLLYLEDRGWKLQAVQMRAQARLVRSGRMDSVRVYRPEQAPPMSERSAVIIDLTAVRFEHDREFWLNALDWLRSRSQLTAQGVPEICAPRGARGDGVAVK